MCRSSSESLTNTGTITWTSLYSQYSAGAWSCLGTGPSHETARKACPHVRAHPQPPSASSAPSLPALRAALKSGKIHLRAQATAAQASDEGTSGEVACVGGGQRWPTHLTGSASSGSSGDDRSRARSSAIVPPQAERPSLRMVHRIGALTANEFKDEFSGRAPLVLDGFNPDLRCWDVRRPLEDSAFGVQAKRFLNGSGGHDAAHHHPPSRCGSQVLAA